MRLFLHNLPILSSSYSHICADIPNKNMAWDGIEKVFGAGFKVSMHAIALHGRNRSCGSGGCVDGLDGGGVCM